MEIRLIGGGPLDGVKMTVGESAFKVTAAAREGKLMAIYERDGDSEAFEFAGFEENDWEDEDDTDAESSGELSPGT